MFLFISKVQLRLEQVLNHFNLVHNIEGTYWDHVGLELATADSYFPNPGDRTGDHRVLHHCREG